MLLRLLSVSANDHRAQSPVRNLPAMIHGAESPVRLVQAKYDQAGSPRESSGRCWQLREPSLDCSSLEALRYPYGQVRWSEIAVRQYLWPCYLLMTVVIDLMAIVHNQHCIPWQLNSKVSDVLALSWLKSSTFESVCHVRIIIQSCKRHSALSPKPTTSTVPSIYQTVKSCLALSACDPFLARI